MAPRRRRLLPEESDEETSSGHSHPRPRSPFKRRRLESHDVESSISRLDSSASDVNVAASRIINDDDFAPGSIVRVRLENFVTYTLAEFITGPHLNMIIGPNGTGKSSLVCAICLGLGYSPKHLGRATSVKEFVKHGTDFATVEIELKRMPSLLRNSIIKLKIRKDQNSQKWWLNGAETSHKTIQDLTKRYKIQVDNLCQFLPQDRVVEFATLNPVDLLHETLRAIASQQMLGWQATLKELHRDQKAVSETITTDREVLQNLENRQQGIQADVNRLREREEIQERVQDLRNAKICAEYHQARKANIDAKAKRKETAEELERLKSESGPSLEAVNQKAAYKAELETAVRSRKKAFKDAEQLANEFLTDIDKVAAEIQGISNEMDAEENLYDNKKREVARLRQKVTAIESQLKADPPEFNNKDWNTKSREFEHRIRDRELERREFEEQVMQLRSQGRTVKDELGKARKAIEQLESLVGQQVSLLRRTNADVARGWEWLCQNQDQFSQEVFGPAMLCCSIKDVRYMDLVQSALGLDDFLCFTVQTREDHRKLSDQLYGKMGLAVSIRTCLASRPQFQAPMGAEELQVLGLDGFAIDYIEGPGKVLAMLCSEKRLHQTGVALEDINAEQYDRLYQGGVVNTWAAGRQLYRVSRRREYGPGAVSTTTRQVLPGRFWKNLAPDASEKAELQRVLNEREAEWNEMMRQNGELRARIEASDADIADLRKESDDVKARKMEQQRAYNQYCALPERIETEKRVMNRHRQELSGVRLKLHEMMMTRDDALVAKAKAVLRHKEQIQEVIRTYQASVESQFRLIEADSDIVGFKETVSNITRHLGEGEANLAVADAEVERTREAGRRAKVIVASMLQNNMEKRELYEQLATNKTAEEIEDETSAEEAKLDLVHAVNPSILREFEARRQEIGRLQKKLDACTKKSDFLSSEITTFRGRYEPQLDELVRKISDAFGQNFERINCAGEVRVDKHANFEQWGLGVMVKFRESEALQQLTQHRQSGGERAVSTVFYMLSLAGLAHAPFRVVDEINQGMDPRNERIMHNRMVEIACRQNSSQYFLVTPKLLPDLRYDRRMRILCIVSGAKMPPPVFAGGVGQAGWGLLDLATCISVQNKVLADMADRAKSIGRGEGKGKIKGKVGKGKGKDIGKGKRKEKEKGKLISSYG